MNYRVIAESIIGLKDADSKLRNKLIQNGQLGNGYNREMEKLHNKHAKILDKIIDEIGYPTINKVGQQANDATWLIIQHSIGKPAFMKKCLKLLENAVNEGNGNPVNLAYLTDRIAMFENKKQLYGTQFDWDENGELSPKSYDNLTKVNERRKSMGLNTLEEQTAIMRKRAEEEKQTSPKDLKKRNKEFEKWKINVGWTE